MAFLDFSCFFAQKYFFIFRYARKGLAVTADAKAARIEKQKGDAAAAIQKAEQAAQKAKEAAEKAKKEAMMSKAKKAKA